MGRGASHGFSWSRRRVAVLSLGALASLAVGPAACSGRTSPPGSSSGTSPPGSSSGSSPGGGSLIPDPGNPGPLPDVFAAYCAGTLLHDAQVALPQQNAGYLANGSLQIAAGSVFLLSNEVDSWNGYSIAKDGTPEWVVGDENNGLVEGADFTSDCNAQPGFGTSHHVLLRDTPFYAGQDLGGTPCTLPRGTELTQMQYQSTSPNLVSSPTLAARCGLSTAYTPWMLYASLVLRSG